MEIPLVFEPVEWRVVQSARKSTGVPWNGPRYDKSFYAYPSGFSQFSNEIQKRLMLTTGTKDLKLLLELNNLNSKSGKDYVVSLKKKSDGNDGEGGEDEERSNKNMSYSLSVTPKDKDAGPSLFQVLRDNFGEKFKVKAKYRYVDSDTETPKLMSYSTGDSGVVLNERGVFKAELTFDECTPSPDLQDESEFGSRVIIVLILCFRIGASKRKMTEQLSSVNRKMLKTEVATDVVIASGDGKEFKCHKSFLFVHSPVLQAMLMSGMEETRTSRIVVPDMSGEVVEAFLQYLYAKDTSGVAGSCELSFGLFYAAHKYQVKCLEAHTIGLLQNLNNEHFPVEIALKLFLLLGNVPSSEELKKKAASVMSEKFDALAALPEYDELDVKVVKELNKYFAMMAKINRG